MGKHGILAESIVYLVSYSGSCAIYATPAGPGYSNSSPYAVIGAIGVPRQSRTFHHALGALVAFACFATLGLTTSCHWSIVNWDPIDKLHRAHTAIKLSMCNVPPADSGKLWPTWKSKAVMRFRHQRMGHFTSNLRPAVRSQTCSRSALGMRSFAAVIVAACRTTRNCVRNHLSRGEKLKVEFSRNVGSRGISFLLSFLSVSFLLFFPK